MTANTINADYAAVADAVQSISNDATTSMKDFAASQAARATRLTAVLARLQSTQTPSSTLDKLKLAISASTALAQAMGGLAGRIARRPTVDPADLAVFGTVLDATGAAAPALSVRLTDSAGTLNAGSRVKTDSSGDFSLVLKSCEVPATATSLVVSVEDAGGVRLAVSDAVTPKAGNPIYIALSLSSKPPAPAPPSSQTGSKPNPTPSAGTGG